MAKIVDFEDLSKNLPNGQNMGGLPQVVYYGIYENVDVWPKRPVAGDGMTLTKMGELNGDLKMKADKFLHRLYITDGEGKLDFEGVGETDGKSFVVKLRIYHPGLNPKFFGLINLAKNENLVFIVPDNNGGLFLLGDEMRAAVLDSIDGLTTGQKTEERPGGGLVFSYKTANIYRYKGSIPLSAGSVTPDPDPTPDPTPDPEMGIMACCPDGVNDYFTIANPTDECLALLYPENNEKLIFTIDMIPVGNALFAFGQKDTFSVHVIYSGDYIMFRTFVAGMSMGAYQAMTVNNYDKRVLFKIELDNESGFHFYVNGIEEVLTLGDVSGSMPSQPASNFFYLFRDDKESDPLYSNSKLISFAIDKKAGDTLTPLVLWDFLGETSAERLKNKMEGMATFDLVAQNVLNIDDVVKRIEVEDLPEQKTEVLACCPDGVDDYLTAELNTLSKLALIPTGDGNKVIYTLDLIPKIIFSLSVANNFSLSFIYAGLGFMVTLYIKDKGYVVQEIPEFDYSNKRVNIRLELSLVDNAPVVQVFLNDVETVCHLVESADVVLSTTDSFVIFNDGGNRYVDSKLFSFAIKKANDGVNFTNSVLWNFEGETDDEKLKNKVNNSWFKLTAHNVADMDEFIKKVVV